MNPTLAFLLPTFEELSPAIQATLVLLLGLALAILVRLLLRRGLTWFRFDRFSDRVGLTEFLRKGGAKYSPVGLVGVMAFWIILFVTFRRMARILDIEVFRAFYRQMDDVMPRLVGALLILVLGLIVVTFLARFTLTLARNAALPSAQAMASSLRYVGLAVVVALALDQVGFGKTILGPMILMAFGAAVFGVALAFGLGCKDLAREAMERFLRELRERQHLSNGSDLEG